MNLWTGSGNDISYTAGSVNTAALNATGAVDFDTTLNVDGAATLADADVTTLDVTGTSTLADANVTTLDVSGATTLGAVTASGAAALNGGTTTSTLTTTGATTLGATLNVTGATTLAGTTATTLTATGAVDFDSTLNVDGATTLGAAQINGDITASDNVVNFADSVAVAGTLGATGNIDTDGAFTMNGGTEDLTPTSCGTDKVIYWDGAAWGCRDAEAASLTGGNSVYLDNLADVDTTGVSNEDCLAYDTANSKWIAQDCSSLGLFLVTDTDPATNPGGEVIHSDPNNAPYATADFVFGSNQLDNTAGADDDKRFFFDKSKAAFRAGIDPWGYWNEVNLGGYSAAFGRNTEARGSGSFAYGNHAQANGDQTVLQAVGSRKPQGHAPSHLAMKSTQPVPTA